MGTLAIFIPPAASERPLTSLGVDVIVNPQIPTSYTITKDASSSMMGMVTSDRIVDSVTKPIPNL